MPAAWRSVRLSMAASSERACTATSPRTDRGTLLVLTVHHEHERALQLRICLGEVFSASGASSLLRHTACKDGWANIKVIRCMHVSWEVHACR